MGGICAKNEAGRVTTDIPPKRMQAQTIESGGPQKVDPERKYVSAGKHFNTVSDEPDKYAKETAEEFCRKNPEWRYTGRWKNIQDTEGAEISWFEVEKGKSNTNNPAAQNNVQLEAVSQKL